MNRTEQTEQGKNTSGGAPVALQRETVMMVNDRGRFGLMMALAALGGVGVGFGLAMVAQHPASSPSSPVAEPSVVAPSIPDDSVHRFLLPAPEPMVFRWSSEDAGDCPHGRQQLGVIIDSVGDGVRVREVLPGLPAQRDGLRVGDVITRYDGQRMRRGNDLVRAVTDTPHGKPVIIILLRDGEQLELEVVMDAAASYHDDD